MLPELGQFSLILALCFALVQALSPLACYRLQLSQRTMNEMALMAVIGQFIFLSVSLLCLIGSFILNDMTVVYVREHSHELLPLFFRIGATWGGHEGSLLLWCVILSGWTLLFAASSFTVPTLQRGWFYGTYVRVIMVLGWTAAGFIIFLIATSSPFTRDFPVGPISGNDLTPLLQDPGLIFHPPMLYLGYVGFAIGFSFAISALIEGDLDPDWARHYRPWAILPWCFLGCGIVLGSWWAYRELGWGGWWFWDPVENASLMPWLVGTALIHCLIVVEKREVFKGWAVLLAIIAFGLSLIGTFLVRSGVLVSVHAFANDPARGVFLLIYIAALLGGALLLYAYRIKRFFKPPLFALFSRETLLLINTVILLTIMSILLLGTLYPILLDAINGEKISVGEPYFNKLFVPIILFLMLLMGIAPHVHWQASSFRALWKKLSILLFLSIFCGIFLPKLWGFPFNLLASIGMTVAAFTFFATFKYVFDILKKTRRLKLKQIAMVIAHLGLATIVLAVSFNKSYSEERQIKIKVGETVTLARWQFYFADLRKKEGSNFNSIEALFNITSNHFHGQLTAEQRIYTSHQQSFSKPGTSYDLWRDLYLTLGTPFPDGSWSVRIYYKPGVRWIWLGGFFIVFGGILAFFQRNHTEERP